MSEDSEDDDDDDENENMGIPGGGGSNLGASSSMNKSSVVPLLHTIVSQFFPFFYFLPDKIFEKGYITRFKCLTSLHKC